MKIDRTRNTSRNIVWGVLERTLLVLLPFITRTVLIKKLGGEYVGLSSLFTSILSVLSIAELGFGSAIVFSMYKPIAEDDNEMLCALLGYYKKIYRCVGIIILVVGLIILPFIKCLINGSIPLDVNIYILYLIYLLNTVISYFLAAYKTSILSAFQRNDILSKRNMFIMSGTNILQCISLFIFNSYYLYVIWIPLSTIAANIMNAYCVKKMYPDIVCKGTLDGPTKRDIKRRVVGLLSFKIYGTIFSSVDTIVISSFLGLFTLAKYNNYYYIQTSIIAFLNIITNSITAGIGNKIVTSSKEENYKDMMNLVFVNGWIVSFCSICLLCLYQPFLEMWVGKEYLFRFDTMILMVMYFLLPYITRMSYVYREAAGLWWEDRFRPLIATIVNLLVNLILVRIIGINGVIISTLFCSVFINIPWGTIILFRNYFYRSCAEYFRNIVYYFCITVMVGAVVFVIVCAIPLEGLIGLVFRMIICMIMPNFLFWMCYKRKEEYVYFKKYVKNILF